MPSNRKTVITGPGRSGTTFLVQLLTEVGLDTGYDRSNFEVDPISHAGLEQPNWHTPESPYIVKSPLISQSIHYTMASGEVEIDHVFLPLRPLRDVVASRERVSQIGGDCTPGGMDSGQNRQRQADQQARQLYGLIMALARYEIPHTLMEFPRLAKDPKYTYRKLSPVLGNIPYEAFLPAFVKVSKPELIHVFDRAKNSSSH